ncbi:hypothetical protein FACS1894109_16920 [Spirochaetia bacterium]|nr:hypothetical protein FACS1894109_16920 [Spirochaetia bacterium]
MYLLEYNKMSDTLSFQHEVKSLEFIGTIGEIDITCCTNSVARDKKLKKMGKRLFAEWPPVVPPPPFKLKRARRKIIRELSQKEIGRLLTAVTIDDKPAKSIVTENDTFIDELFDLLLDISLNFYGVFGQFSFMGVDADGKTGFDDSESEENIRLNQEFGRLKLKLGKLMDLIRTFTENIYVHPGIRYLSKYTTTEEIDEQLNKIIEQYANLIKMVLPQFRPIVESHYQNFILLIRILNTAIGKYNLSSVGKQFPFQQL